MKNTITKDDAKRIHDAFISVVRQYADNGHMNYLLLSGGIDSVCVLYALMELGVPYKVINFKFPDRDSIDTNSVRKLQQQIGFEAEYYTLERFNENILIESVDVCLRLFGLVRQVKVETIYAMLQLRQYIPKGVNIYTGFGGDAACAYHKNDAMLIAREGEDCEKILRIRHGEKQKDELRYVFSDWTYCNPFHEQELGDVICDYTSKAMNAGFPKSGLVLAFAEYFAKYKNARKPIGFHKASCEVQMFEEIAKENGFPNALKYFNSIAKEKVNAG